MKAAGIPLKQVVVPVLAGGAVLSLVCLILQDTVQPKALQRANRLIFEELQTRLTLDALPAGIMQDFGDWRVYIGNKDAKTRELRDIAILIPGDGGPKQSLYAESAYVEKRDDRAYLVLNNGHMLQALAGGGDMKSSFEHTTWPLPELRAKDIPSKREELTLRELYREQAVLTTQLRADPSPSIDTLEDLRKLRVEFAKRLSLSLACLAVSLVGAPLGVRAKRSGRSYSFAIGMAIILSFYVLYVFSEPGRLCSLTETVARYMTPNILLIAAGAWFLWRVDRV